MSQAKMENRALPKRFYTDVALAPVADGHAILLDGKELKTQGRNPLHLVPQTLAEAVAAEWRAQETHINPDMMPLTRLANIARDRMALDRLAVLEQICAYGETDLVCYRAPADPLPEGEGGTQRSWEGEGIHGKTSPFETEQASPHWLPLPSPSGRGLCARQSLVFDPLLAWVRETNHIDLHITEGVMPMPQSTASLHHLYTLFAASNDAELAALAMLVPLLGSAVLTLALWKRRITVDDALKAARLDEDFQAEQWGIDHEVVAAWEGKCRDIRAAAFFLRSV